jgi:hypothetical protein
MDRNKEQMGILGIQSGHTEQVGIQNGWEYRMGRNTEWVGIQNR